MIKSEANRFEKLMKPIKWVKENVNWLFSGAGLLVISVIISLFFPNKNNSSQHEVTQSSTKNVINMSVEGDQQVIISNNAQIGNDKDDITIANSNVEVINTEMDNANLGSNINYNVNDEVKNNNTTYNYVDNINVVKLFPKEVEINDKHEIKVRVNNIEESGKVYLLFADSKGHYDINYLNSERLQIIDGFWKILHKFKEKGDVRYQIWVENKKFEFDKSHEYLVIVEDSNANKDELYFDFGNISEGNEVGFEEIETYIGLIDYNLYDYHELVFTLTGNEKEYVKIKLPYSQLINFKNKKYRLSIEDGVGYSMIVQIKEMKNTLGNTPGTDWSDPCKVYSLSTVKLFNFL